jgi:hypothetical protein
MLEDNIKMAPREMGLEDVDWIHLAQDKEEWWELANMVMNLRVPYNAENIFVEQLLAFEEELSSTYFFS